jgi:glycosyltransferase involved in cell wall biosynthesis
LFLAKAAWKVKNVAGAIRIARSSRRPLHILGGRRWLWNHWRGVHWEGMMGGQEKSNAISRSAALLFPVRWNEPFGIAVIEALVSGTPVLASGYGSLPELVPPEGGAICRTEAQFVEAITRLGEFRASDCRDWVISQFHYRQMAKQYVQLYERVIRGERLNPTPPVATEEATRFLPLPRL